MDQELRIQEIIQQLEDFAEENDAIKITYVRLKLGALTAVDPEDFKSDFGDALTSTIADGARIDVEVSDDPGDPDADDVVLLNMQVE